MEEIKASLPRGTRDGGRGELHFSPGRRFIVYAIPIMLIAGTPLGLGAAFWLYKDAALEEVSPELAEILVPAALIAFGIFSFIIIAMLGPLFYERVVRGRFRYD